MKNKYELRIRRREPSAWARFYDFLDSLKRDRVEIAYVDHVKGWAMLEADGAPKEFEDPFIEVRRRVGP